MHLFKVCLTHADLFISALDLREKTIEYSVRAKESGQLVEPHFKSKLILNDSQIIFDQRHIILGLAKHIEHTLKTTS